MQRHCTTDADLLMPQRTRELGGGYGAVAVGVKEAEGVWRRSSTAAASPAMVTLSVANSSRLMPRRRVLHKRVRV